MYLLHFKKLDIYANISLFLSYSKVTIATQSSPYPAQMITAVTRSSPYPDQVITAVIISSPYPDQMITAVTRSSPYPDQMITAVNRSSPYPDQMIIAVNRSSPYPDQMITAVTRSSPYPDQMITAVNRSSPYPDQMITAVTRSSEPQRQISSSPRQPSGKDHWNQWSPYNLTLLQLEQTTGLSGRRGTDTRLSLVSPKVFSPFCHRWSIGSLLLLPLACLVGDTSFPAISPTLLHRYYLN